MSSQANSQSSGLQAVYTFIIILSNFTARELMTTAMTARTQDGAWGTCAWVTLPTLPWLHLSRDSV